MKPYTADELRQFPAINLDARMNETIALILDRLKALEARPAASEPKGPDDGDR
jgi:hypothetical protein